MNIYSTIISMILCIYLSIHHAQGSNLCTEPSTFDSHSDVLTIPCLYVDDKEYYSASLAQKTKNTFILQSYEQTVQNVTTTPYYNNLNEAHEDGLVQYLPLSLGRGEFIIDYGSANYSTAYSHNGGTWISTDVESKYGKLLKLTRQSGYIAPLPDPTAISKTYTIFVILPGREQHSEFHKDNNQELLYINKQNNINCGQQTVMNIFFDESSNNYRSTIKTVCRPQLSQEVSKDIAQNKDGVVHVFFSYDGNSYTSQLGISEEVSLAQPVDATNANALRIGRKCSSENCTGQANALMYSYAMWNRVLSKSEKDAIVTSGSELINEPSL